MYQLAVLISLMALAGAGGSYLPPEELPEVEGLSAASLARDKAAFLKRYAVRCAAFLCAVMMPNSSAEHQQEAAKSRKQRKHVRKCADTTLEPTLLALQVPRLWV